MLVLTTYRKIGCQSVKIYRSFHRFGRLPKRGEVTTIGGLRFQVLRADSRRLHVLQVQRLPAKA